MPHEGSKHECDELAYIGGTIVYRIKCSEYLQPNLGITYHLPQQPDTNSPALRQHTTTDRESERVAPLF